MVIAVQLGLLYGIMALGVYLTYRVLDFPDLTVDGSFTTGGAVAAVMIVGGTPAWLATLCGVVAGGVAGVVTALLHTVGRINPLLSGILTQIALYSINLRIMGKANVPLLGQTTVFTWLRRRGLFLSWTSVGLLAVLVGLVMALLVWFLLTEVGAAIRATGDNPDMASSQGISTNHTKVYGLVLSNALVGGCGALVSQYAGFADISMGIGMIVAGLASVIVGQAILGQRTVWMACLAAVVGSIVYRAVLQLALNAGLNPNDMKLISAVLVVIALTLPRFAPLRRWRAARASRTAIPEPAAVAASAPAGVTTVEGGER